MVVEKSSGITESEHRLVKLGEKVFMGLWSYPNPRVKTSAGFPELCDLLVVCGDTVLVFSDKNIKFNETKGWFVGWKRWEKHAILESISQLHHAENILRKHPDMIWLNARQRLPVSIPDSNQIKIHLICVANGATDACKKFFGAGCTGSLRFSNLKEKTMDYRTFTGMSQNAQEEYLSDNIFTTHDYDETKTFVHVFDDYSFPFVLNELDTLTDFVKYLNEKENFIRKHNVMYTGEEDLLYRYFHNFDSENQCHTFLPKEDKDKQISLCCFCEEDWDIFKRSREYLSGRRENKPSYFWDYLVQENAYCALQDITQIIYQSHKCHDKDIALRYMAMEDRLSRRGYATAILGSIDRCEPDQIRMTAFMSNITHGLLYIFLQVDNQRSSTYTDYVEKRRQLLERYINFAKAKSITENVEINKIVGIAIEPPKYRHVTGTDLVYAEFKAWPASEQKFWEAERIKQGVFRQPISEWRHMIEKEWPDSGSSRKIGVNEKCPCGSEKKYKKCCGSLLSQTN